MCADCAAGRNRQRIRGARRSPTGWLEFKTTSWSGVSLYRRAEFDTVERMARGKSTKVTLESTTWSPCIDSFTSRPFTGASSKRSLTTSQTASVPWAFLVINADVNKCVGLANDCETQVRPAVRRSPLSSIMAAPSRYEVYVIQATLTESSCGPRRGHKATAPLTQPRFGQLMDRLHGLRSSVHFSAALSALEEVNEHESLLALVSVVFKYSQLSNIHEQSDENRSPVT